MIKNIVITAGGSKLQEYPGEYLYCMVQRDFNNSKKDLWEKMIGQTPELTDPANANVPQELLINEAERISKAKTSILGGMSIKDAAVLFGLGTAGLGFLIDRTTDQGDVGTRVDPYKKHGLDYGWEAPTIVYDYDRPIVPAMGHGGVMDLQGGGESMGPGTGTSDSIPAMLSDGEFVMTAKAVRGAGGGDRREGARKMYEAMDRLEARA